MSVNGKTSIVIEMRMDGELSSEFPDENNGEGEKQKSYARAFLLRFDGAEDSLQ